MRCVRALLHDRAGLACLLFLGIVLLAALLAPWLTPWDPLAVDGSRKLAPCGPGTLAGHGQAGARHLFPPALRGPGHAGRLAADHGGPRSRWGPAGHAGGPCARAGGVLPHAAVRRDAFLPRRGHGAGHRGHAGAGAGERGAGLRGAKVAVVRAHDADYHPPLCGQGLRAFRACGGLRHGPYH